MYVCLGNILRKPPHHRAPLTDVITFVYPILVRTGFLVYNDDEGVDCTVLPTPIFRDPVKTFFRWY